ncbi:MAG: hypothetical protein ABH827_04755 [bacterium]
MTKFNTIGREQEFGQSTGLSAYVREPPSSTRARLVCVYGILNSCVTFMLSRVYYVALILNYVF